MTGWAWLLAPIGLAQPVLLALLVPRRWLRRALLGWLALPIPVWAFLVLQELATRPAPPELGRNLVLGFGIVMSTIGLAWVVGSGLCFALGLWLRRRFRPERPAAPAPASPAPRHVASPPAPAGPVLPNGAGLETRDSPDGRLRVSLAAVEWFNTHWVNAPRVEDRSTGRALLDLWGTDWDATVGFSTPGQVWLGLRRYGGPGAWSLVLDIDAGTATLAAADSPSASLSTFPLAEAGARLEAASQALRAAVPHCEPLPPKRFAAWRSAVVILLCAILAIAGLTWLTMPEPAPQQPQRLPAFPPTR